MTEFGTLVAEALRAGEKSPCAVCQIHAEDWAPRVAAAILATREKCAELTSGAVVLASVHGSTLPVDALQQVEAAALRALRGEDRTP